MFQISRRSASAANDSLTQFAHQHDCVSLAYPVECCWNRESSKFGDRHTPGLDGWVADCCGDCRL